MRTKQYIDECLERFEKGGSLWFIKSEGHYYVPSMEMRVHTFGKGYNKVRCHWSEHLGSFEVYSAYLSKEDAEKDLMFKDDIERGCCNCGYGGVKVEIVQEDF